MTPVMWKLSDEDALWFLDPSVQAAKSATSTTAVRKHNLFMIKVVV
jgi:hypothetical protein